MEYYRAIREGVNRHSAAGAGSPPYPIPPVSFDSLNKSRTIRHFGRDDDPNSWRDFDGLFRKAFHRLEYVGCDSATGPSQAAK